MQTTFTIDSARHTHTLTHRSREREKRNTRSCQLTENKQKVIRDRQLEDTEQKHTLLNRDTQVNQLIILTEQKKTCDYY